MLNLPSMAGLFIPRGATDIGKSFDTLAALVIDVAEDAFPHGVFEPPCGGTTRLEPAPVHDPVAGN